MSTDMRDAGPWNKSIARLEQWLTEVYERNPRRYLVFMLTYVPAGFVVFLGPLGAFMASYYAEPTVAGFLKALLGVESTVAVTQAAAFFAFRRELRTLWRWLAERPTEPEELAQASDAARTLILKWLATGVPVGWFVAPVLVPLALGQLGNLRLDAFVAMGGWYAVTYGGLVAVFSGELALLPIRTDIGARLERSVTEVRLVFPFVMRLLIALLSLCMTGGWFAATFLTEPGSRGTGDAWIAFVAPLAVGASLGLILTVFFAQGLTIPVRHLMAGMRAVGQGNLDSRLAITSSDEFGVLQSGFNEMVNGLRDRERLRDANAELVHEVRASRARIVAAADESRKRIERNIHDGAQQRLVALALDLRMLEEQVPAEFSPAVHSAADDVKAALGELRELARGLHPSVLTTDGLGPAIDQLASRASIPVAVDVTQARFPESVETACYFTVAEALANVAKYADATEAAIRIAQQDGHVELQVSDNGRGGADPKAGSGLTGLVDRIAALDGTLTVDSPVGVGTTLTVELPLPPKGPA